MKKRDLEKLGLEGEAVLAEAVQVCSTSRNFGIKKAQLKRDLQDLVSQPERYAENECYGSLARAVIREREKESTPQYTLREGEEYPFWGDEIDPQAHEQMRNACRLPVTRAGALMPDAHVGYGLPIGGVLATEGAVIPYAVGVDIACRVMVSVFDLPATDLQRKRTRFEEAIEKNTKFGIGARWKQPKNHPVMDEDWSVSKRVRDLKDMAWAQLGTSGSGNHFVEFGLIRFKQENGLLEPRDYVAVVSHSGSRGPGSRIADHYSKLAMDLHPDLPKALRHLAWLPMDGIGAEYWEAMELMGRYASANHHVIHKNLCRFLGLDPILQVENHHNFAWKEEHGGRELIVHRKGATPAGKGQLGYIPGSMTAPGYLVEGLGNEESLRSCSHGAGRKMSRKRAKNTITRHALKEILREEGVHLLSAGLDESPHAYKDIDEVMKAQAGLVRTLAKFQPRIVKMAPEGERPED